MSENLPATTGEQPEEEFDEVGVPKSLAELFLRDPLEWTQTDRLALIAKLREGRRNFAAAENAKAAGKEGAPKRAAKTTIKSLDAANKPKPGKIDLASLGLGAGLQLPGIKPSTEAAKPAEQLSIPGVKMPEKDPKTGKVKLDLSMLGLSYKKEEPK